MRVINLLPKIRQQELRFEAMLRSLWAICWLTLFSFLVVLSIQVALKFYLQFEAGSIKSQITQLQAVVARQQNNDLKTRVTNINNLISDYNNLAENSPKWSKLIKAFVPLIPDSVRINSFNVDPKTKLVSISGISPTRELVIEIYNRIIKDNKEFYNINYPLENVAKPKNVTFHFNFYYKDDLIK